MANVVNWFTLLIILIFDPLAVALVIVLNNLTGKGSEPEESKAERVKAPTPTPEPDPVPEPKKLDKPEQPDIYNEKKSKPDKPKRRPAYWT
jgi:hypothetical protein